MARLQQVGRRIGHELVFLRKVLEHAETPWFSRILLGVALAYFVSPIDLIPDVVPVLGQLDDLIIVPGLIWLAMRLIPANVIAACR